MGYYTRFAFTITPTELHDPVMDALREISGYDFDDSCKWYDHKEHLRQVSARYPEAMIEVIGHGEDDNDIWKIYAVNGEIERVNGFISFPATSLRRPTMREVSVSVLVAGHSIPVRMQTWDGESPDALRKRALLRLAQTIKGDS